MISLMARELYTTFSVSIAAASMYHLYTNGRVENYNRFMV
jgi:hypothetical protein